MVNEDKEDNLTYHRWWEAHSHGQGGETRGRSRANLFLSPPENNSKHRIYFLPRDATQSAVVPQYVVSPSVCFSHRLEYLENNFTGE